MSHGVEYTLNEDTLVLSEDFLKDKQTFRLETKVEISPEKNTALTGLYSSSGILCTQCEAEGFRRITFSQDRPDVLSKYTVYLEGKKELFPVLLSNGNLIQSGVCPVNSSNHFAVFDDPFFKPSYLFALVAGRLDFLSDYFTTKSGNKVLLQIFSEPKNIDKLDYAMEALKDSMRWDEERFGLEYDLDVYNIVAVDDFNMGAMENKSLNVFNSSAVLAHPKFSTDADYQRVQSVIAHEYFHNWTGNRVTCRDWFQLTLKEGLTVFRDQEFSADMNSAAVCRIQDVKDLRSRQFPEDSGPLSHPIRLESYNAIDNFYTATVYEKGAEVIRMYQNFLGHDGFRKGMDLYFHRHDGTAATCDDFRKSMADANGFGLDQFELWYSQKGTPTIKVTSHFNESENEYSLTFEQKLLDQQKPFDIPVSLGLLVSSDSGLTYKEDSQFNQVFRLNQIRQTLSLKSIPSRPIPSLFRQFSAPVVIEDDLQAKDLQALLSFDSDSFVRWESGQKLAEICIEKTLNGEDSPSEIPLLLESFEKILSDAIQARTLDFDHAFMSLLLQLPGEDYLGTRQEVLSPLAIRKARKAVLSRIGNQFYDRFLELYFSLAPNTERFQVDHKSIGRRSLRNVCLTYLTAKDDSLDLAASHYHGASCMTDRVAALSLMVKDLQGPVTKDALSSFYEEFKTDALSLNKWFVIQALADSEDVLQRIYDLSSHPDFAIKNPNRFRSVVSAFAMNAAFFHHNSGKGYDFVMDMILRVDEINPQLAARTCNSFSSWKKLEKSQQTMVETAMKKGLDSESLSDNTREMLTRLLA
jgi:aminopeptidase N